MNLTEIDPIKAVSLAIEVIVVLSCIVTAIWFGVLANKRKRELVRQKSEMKQIKSKLEWHVTELEASRKMQKMLLSEIKQSENDTVLLSAKFPERKDGDSDAKFSQRCRMAVITKAYDYVRFIDDNAVLMVVK